MWHYLITPGSTSHQIFVAIVVLIVAAQVREWLRSL